ncbi:uncharacterized protein CBL_01980 [Carabus blaptoides fortunei]
MSIKPILLLACLAIVQGDERKFPNDFLFGIASSAYQIEGGWNENGKGENIWDRYSHKHPENILDGSNGDVSCDSYHKYKEDIKILKNLGVDVYRFSLSWTRILPTGYINKINPDGIHYYNNLINELIENKITPMITIYHWDLPQSIQEVGGWPNPLIADYFVDFARVAFENFGDRVKLWITLNEPYHICATSYGTGAFAPGYKRAGIADYMCSYTALLAHAKVYHMYNEEFRHKQQGKVGISLDAFWYEPKTNSAEDKEAAELALQMTYGWFVHPIYSKQGDFPAIMKQRVLNMSLIENYRRSRLPEFTKEQIKYIQGTSDFLGLNHYSTFTAEFSDNPDTTNPYYSRDMGINLEQRDTWPATPTYWIKIVPWGLRKLLNWIKDEFDNPDVYITENGMGDSDGTLNDEQRVNYLREYLGAVLDSILEDGCNVKVYCAWSLADNFEWSSGYT